MRKALFLPLLLLAAPTAMAQADCAKPVVKLLHNNQEIPATGSALVPRVTLQVVPEAGCPAQSYRFRNVEVTLVHNGRPALPTFNLNQSQLDLRPFMRVYQPGDHLLVFIAYQNVALVAPDGTLTPLRSAKAAKPKPGQLDLQPDESRGISFKWPLLKQ